MLAVKTDGTLWAWGRAANGGLGDGTTVAKSSPVQVGALTTWATVLASTARHSLAVKTDGTLWSWGANFNGQLGLGNTTSYSSPKQVGALTTWSKLSGGQVFSHAIKTDGTLWAWGDGGAIFTPGPYAYLPAVPARGALGLGNTTVYSSPKQVGALTTWTEVSSRDYAVLAIKT